MSKKVLLGTREYIFPSDELAELECYNGRLDDQVSLQEEISDKGYIFIRGLHDRQEVLDSRLATLEYIGDDKFSKSHQLNEGVLDERCGRGCVPFMEGRNSITHSQTILKVLEGPRVYNLFKTLFGEEPRTFDFKWLRAMHRGGFTGAHVDSVYMARGTQRLLTIWTPFGDIPTEMGTLAICQGSHKLSSFRPLQETYGEFDVEEADLQGTGWFTEDPAEISSRFGGTWKTADFRAGDALIFSLRTVHMSTVNMTHFARISCDTRWQPASHKVDVRYVGDSFEVKAKFGIHSRQTQSDHVTMDQMKKRWGFL